MFSIQKCIQMIKNATSYKRFIFLLSKNSEKIMVSTKILAAFNMDNNKECYFTILE